MEPLELRAIATLQGEPAENFQRTSVHVTVKIEELPDVGKARFDLAVMGDVRQPGPGWQPGDIETGPNYHTSGELGGKLVSPERGERLLQVVGIEIRVTLSLRLRRIAKSWDAEGKSLLVFRVMPDPEGFVDQYDKAPPVGDLAENFIGAIGAELRAFVQSELQGSLVAAPVTVEPGEQPKYKLPDQRALELWKAGTLPLKPDQVKSLHERLGLPVPL